MPLRNTPTARGNEKSTGHRSIAEAGTAGKTGPVVKNAWCNSPRVVIQRQLFREALGTSNVHLPDCHLPEPLKGGLEQLSGYALDDVKVHYNSEKPAQIGATAYAQGCEIHLGPGAEKHLPHEAWHVVQQKQGIVQPTQHIANHAINDNKQLEHEADVMGMRAQTGNVDALETMPKQKSGNGGVVQMKRVPVVVPGITHLVRLDEGSLYKDNFLENEEIEVSHGDIVVIDDAKQILSRRGPNQEVNQERDKHGHSNNLWFGALEVQGKNRIELDDDIFIREGTFVVMNESNSELNDLQGKANMKGWNAGNPLLTDAHHKFPKSAIAWLWEHMTPEQKSELRQALGLASNAEAGALARLRSLLITPKTGTGAVVKSENRTDDPHHNRQASPQGEEFLDLVHTQSGSLTPRSAVVKSLSSSVINVIYAQYKLWELSDEEEDFTLSELHFKLLLSHLVTAEKLHAAIEKQPLKPSHSSGDVWHPGYSNPYKKQGVSHIAIPNIDLDANYATVQDEARKANDTRKQIIRRWLEWKRKPSTSDLDDQIKCDFVGRKGWALRYIHGPRRGKLVPDAEVYPAWQQELEEFANGTRTADTMPWLDSLFIHD